MKNKLLILAGFGATKNEAGSQLIRRLPAETAGLNAVAAVTGQEGGRSGHGKNACRIINAGFLVRQAFIGCLVLVNCFRILPFINGGYWRPA